jgi:hypothetical protein
MAIRDVALKIKKWAQANQMIGITRESPEVDLGTIRAILAESACQPRLESFRKEGSHTLE